MTTDEGGNTLVWDAWGRLVRVSDSASQVIGSYEYDALYRRIGQNGSQLIYSANWQVLEERDAATGKTQAQYVWSPVYVDAMILRDRDTDGDGDVRDAGGGERVYVLHDANFNVTALTDASGNVIERFVYDPYGMRMVLDANWTADADGESDVAFVHGHQGLRYNSATDLYDSRLRPYDPALGRFASQDPLGYIDGANRYQAYGGGPGNHVDPLGLSYGDIAGFAPAFGDFGPWAPADQTLVAPAGVAGTGETVLIDYEESDDADPKDNVPAPGVQGSSVDIGIVPDPAAKRKAEGVTDWALFSSRWYSYVVGDSWTLKVTGVYDMVDKLIEAVKTRREVLKSDKVYLTRIVVRAHGNVGSVTLGYVERDGRLVQVGLTRDMIDPASEHYNPKVVEKLRELRPYLGRDAELVLWSCHTGADERFLQLLADILGISVVGTTDDTDKALANLANPFTDLWNRRYPGGPLPPVTETDPDRKKD